MAIRNIVVLPYDKKWQQDFLDIKKELRADDVQAVIQALAGIGYNHEGNLGIPGREAFGYSGKEHLREHHLYLCPENSPVIEKIYKELGLN